MSWDDTVQIRRHELQHMLEEVRHVVRLLDDLSRERPIIFMVKNRLEVLLNAAVDETTPSRPSSSSAMEAFRVTTDATDKKK